MIELVILLAIGDALNDLRGALNQLPATAPVHGSFEISSTASNSDEAQPFAGKATVGFEVTDAGLHIVYPRAILVQAAQEARATAIDGDRQTPTRSGVSRVRALHLAELLDAAAALNVELLNAEVIETRPASYRGKPARLVALKITPKLSQGASKHMKKLDVTLSLWLGDDGVPLGAERVSTAKASFLLMSFESTEKQTWTYARAGDRLIATRYEDTQKSDGFGQHNSSQVTEVVRIEP